MAVVATITVPNPRPASEPYPAYRVRAVCPLAAGIDRSKLWYPGAWGQENLYPVQSRVVGKMGTLDLVEVVTLASPGVGTIAIQDDFVEGLVTPITIFDEAGFDAALLSYVQHSDRIRLLAVGQPGAKSESIVLSGRPMLQVRQGRYMLTWGGHVQSGHFGGFHYWFTINGYDPYLYLDINWHNGVPRADILFKNLFLIGPQNYRWVPVLIDDFVANPGNNALVSLGNHILPRRFERPFRVIFYNEEFGPAPTIRYDRGLGFADTWANGGFLPHSLEMPDLSHIAGLTTSLQAAYASARTYMLGSGTSGPNNTKLPDNDPVYGSGLSFFGATWTESTKTLTKVGAFTNYTHAPNTNVINISAGTGAVIGSHHTVASKLSNDAITLETSIGAAADGQTNIDGWFIGKQALSRFLPAWGVPYGGATSGTAIEINQGMRTLAAKYAEGILMHKMAQLRWRTRNAHAIYCDMAGGAPINIGLPTTPENNLDATGTAPWAMGEFSNFLKQQSVVRDGPWFFSSFGRPAGPIDYDPTPAVTAGSDQNDAFLGGFDTVDMAHWIRAARDNHFLAWVDADPIAILYEQVDAELSRMRSWNKPGQWRVVNTGSLVADKGCPWGRAIAWTCYAVAAGAVFGKGARLARLKAYAIDLMLGVEKGQMPSGLVQCFDYFQGGKGVSAPPFGNNSTADYFVAQSFQECFWVYALAAMRESFGDAAFALPGGRTIFQILQDMANGFRNLAWHTDADGQTISGSSHTGPWKRYPLGAYPGVGRYTTRADFVPLNICVVDPQGDTPLDNVNEPYHVGDALGFMMRAGKNVDLDLQRFTQTASNAAALTAMLGWGLAAPSAQAGAPLENWAVLLNELQP